MTMKRLSLADFKVTKIESRNEIDKLIGGAAAECHEKPIEAATKYVRWTLAGVPCYGSDPANAQ